MLANETTDHQFVWNALTKLGKWMPDTGGEERLMCLKM